MYGRHRKGLTTAMPGPSLVQIPFLHCTLESHRLRYSPIYHSFEPPSFRSIPIRCSPKLLPWPLLLSSPVSNSPFPRPRTPRTDVYFLFAYLAAAATSCVRTYTVKDGDFCDAISAAQNVSTCVVFRLPAAQNKPTDHRDSAVTSCM